MIEDHGGFMNLATGHTTPLRIDPATWRRIQKRRKSNGAAKNRSPVGTETVSLGAASFATAVTVEQNPGPHQRAPLSS